MRSWAIGQWMDDARGVCCLYKKYFPSLFGTIPLPIIYFVDGHRSHTDYEAAAECQKLGIILISLYANSTHIIQPADVAIFRSLKAAWTREVRDWQSNNPGKIIRIAEFGGILEKAINNSYKRETVVNGFKACGLFPFDESAVDYKKCIAGIFQTICFGSVNKNSC